MLYASDRNDRAPQPLMGYISLIALSTVITLGVMESSASAFPVTPTALSYSASTTNPTPPVQTVTFSKKSLTPRSWTTSSNVAWAIVSPASGTIAREKDQVSVQVNASGLSAGTYNGTVQIAIADKYGRTQVTPVPVTLVVTNGTATPTPSIQLNPPSLSFSGTAGGATPLARTIALANPTGGTLTWALTETAPWLGLNVVNGTTTTEVDSISASVSITGLAAGTYSTTISVAASGASNSPQVIPVTLTLTPPATTGSATLSWSANTEPDLAGYKVYVGTQPGTYGAPIATGASTTYTVGGLAGGRTYYFSVSAVDSAGNESAPSSEVSKPVP